MSPFAERVKKLRQQKGLRVSDLSKLSGVPAQALYQLEAGRFQEPSAERAGKIAAALGVNVTYLVSGAESTGFQEAPLAPFEGKEAESDAITRAIAPDARHPALMRATEAIPLGAGIQSGDLIAVDLGALPHEGQLVVVNSVDMDSGTAITTIRRKAGGFLLSVDGVVTESVQVNDGEGMAIMGPVVAILRR